MKERPTKYWTQWQSLHVKITKKKREVRERRFARKNKEKKQDTKNTHIRCCKTYACIQDTQWKNNPTIHMKKRQCDKRERERKWEYLSCIDVWLKDNKIRLKHFGWQIVIHLVASVNSAISVADVFFVVFFFFSCFLHSFSRIHENIYTYVRTYVLINNKVTWPWVCAYICSNPYVSFSCCVVLCCVVSVHYKSISPCHI